MIRGSDRPHYAICAADSLLVGAGLPAHEEIGYRGSRGAARRGAHRPACSHGPTGARDPSKPNLRQVHLIHGELHDELRSGGFAVGVGEMGENVTTRGVPVLDLATGTLLHLGDEAVVEVTGLRNPCVQLDGIQDGLLAAVLGRDEDGNLVRRGGIMGVVLRGGDITAGDRIRIEPPDPPHHPLRPV